MRLPFVMLLLDIFYFENTIRFFSLQVISNGMVRGGGGP